MEIFCISTSLAPFSPPSLLPKALTLNIHQATLLDILRTVDHMDCFLYLTLFTSPVVSLKAKETEEISCEMIFNLVLCQLFKMFMFELAGRIKCLTLWTGCT